MVNIAEHAAYACVPSKCIRDTSVSLKAKGIYSMICNCAENWNYSVEGFASISVEGAKAVGNAIKELEQHGYITREYVRGEDAHFQSVNYVVVPEALVEERAATFRGADNHQRKVITNINNNKVNNTYINNTNKRNTLFLTGAEDVEQKLGRSIMPNEIEIYRRWETEGVDRKFIMRAIEDNFYRNNQCTLKYVDETLDTWNKAGLKTIKDIENYILDAQYNNTRMKLLDLFNGDEEKVSMKLDNSQTGIIYSWRNGINQAFAEYDNGRNTSMQDYLDRALLDGVKPEIFKYLSNDILVYAADLYDKYNEPELKAEALEAIDNMEVGV